MRDAITFVKFSVSKQSRDLAQPETINAEQVTDFEQNWYFELRFNWFLPGPKMAATLLKIICCPRKKNLTKSTPNIILWGNIADNSVEV